jgi:non-specific serine/threonine protein kinase
LTGPGGCGKTRLALALLDSDAGSAWFVDLAPLTDRAQVPQAVAAALGLREQSERPLADTIVHTLADSAGLIVLDNCEHLLEPVAALVDRLFGECSALRVLATSREVLGIRGEIAWQVPPLATADSVQLFVERARAVRRTFLLDEDNAEAVANLCQRLDGLPLAIELAAARTNVLGVEQILARLPGGPTDVLTSRARGVSPRQQTLLATIAWSYDLLDASERDAFCRFAIFAASWSLDAAEAMCEGDALDLLGRLVDKSLVQVEDRHAQARYQLLDTIRQYALERLVAAGLEQPTRLRHARFYARLADEAAVGLTSASPGLWLRKLEADYDNLRAALTWLAEFEPDAALQMAARLWWLWFRAGLWHDGRTWLTRLLEVRAGARPARAEALLGLGVLAWAQGDLVQAREALESSVALGEPAERALAGQFLAMAVLAQGDVARAAALVDDAVTALRALGPSLALGFALASQGVARLAEHAAAAARPPLEESVELLRAFDDPWALALPLRNLGIIAFQAGDLERADAFLRDSLTALQAQRDPWFVSRSLETLATITAARGRYARATRLFGAAEALRDRVGAAVLSFYQAGYDDGVARARAALGPSAFGTAWAAGRAMHLDQALAYALEVEPQALAGLSPREREVLTLLARGLSNRAIAEALVVTEKTAEAHVSAILRKLDLTSRAQAAVWAVEHGIS